MVYCLTGIHFNALPRIKIQAIRGEDITIYGNGQQSRSFCYVDELREGFVRYMQSFVDLPYL